MFSALLLLRSLCITCFGSALHGRMFGSSMEATASWRPDWPSCLSCCGLLCDGAAMSSPSSSSAEPPPLAKDPSSEPLVLLLDERFISSRVEVSTDGARVYNQVAILRQAGLGAWWADWHPSNISKPLEGPCQTNNQAELKLSCMLCNPN